MATGATTMQSIERAIETIIVMSRWLMAPFYLGLILTLILLFVKFVQQLGIFIFSVGAINDTEVILQVLTLVDLAFTGNLVLIVVFSGYENFVSKIDMSSHDRPEWMTKVDFTGLKQKLITSIVAISGIQVLKAFMNIEQYDNGRLGWMVGIYVVFVGSMLVLAVADWLGETDSKREHLQGKRPTESAAEENAKI